MVSDSSPQVPKKVIFGSKFKDFIFKLNFGTRKVRGHWFEIWQFHLLNSNTKIRKLEIFGPIFNNFYFFNKFCYNTSSRAMITKMTIVLENCSPKHISGSRFKNFKILHETLQLDKFYGVDYKYGNSF